MDQVTLERDGKGPLQFTGFVLSEVSTETQHKPRWTELTLWAVEDSDVAFWVVEIVGRSDVEGEIDRRAATACSTVDEVVACLSRKGKLTAPGVKLLELAAESDDDIQDYINGTLKKVERL